MKDIANILKDQPEGIVLYCPLFGKVELLSVSDNVIYAIAVSDERRIRRSFDRYGRYYCEFGDCVLFPSKENRDWDNSETF